MAQQTTTAFDAPQRLEVIALDTPIGAVTLAATDRGVAYVLLPGASSDALVEAFLRRAPCAEIAAVDTLTLWLEPGAAAVMAALAGADRPLPPLDLAVTAFEQQVLDEICRIPRGETRSYQQVANAIGHPKATRAVGQACSANPVPILVPCHRVIGESGRLTGFLGGLDMKARLLAREGALLT
jgi:methylated-DNA-[protein]-cysteine S-methyltransferase